VDPDTAQRDDLGGSRGDQPGELPVEVLDLGVEGAEAQRELLHRVAGRGRHGVGLVTGPELRRDRDASSRGASFELLAQDGGCGHGHRLQLVGHLATRCDRRTPCNAQNTDHLHIARSRLGSNGGLARERLAGGCLGIDRVRLAGVAAQLAVGPLDLDDHHATLTQPAGQPGAVRAGALDTDRVDRAERAGPGVELREPSGGGGELELPEPASELVERDRDMGVLVGVGYRG
jgi:hypothetical protein